MFKLIPFRLALSLALALAPSLLLAACGGDNDPSADAGAGGTEQEACASSFLPLKTGVKWSYDVRDTTSGDAETKETTVGELEAVSSKPGLMAYRLITRKGGTLADETVSWQQRTGKQIARYQEQSYAPGQAGGAPTPTLLEWWDPYKLRLDESKLKLGDKWTVAYKEFSRDKAGVEAMPRDRNESWEVMGVNEMLTTGAGTFKTLHVRRVGTDQNATSDKQYWFACGVGKVKESGAGGRVEELVKTEGL
jgi:hypothetical protein